MNTLEKKVNKCELEETQKNHIHNLHEKNKTEPATHTHTILVAHSAAQFFRRNKLHLTSAADVNTHTHYTQTVRKKVQQTRRTHTRCKNWKVNKNPRASAIHKVNTETIIRQFMGLLYKFVCVA